MAKKKSLPIERDEILNLWLTKFHNTNVKEVIEKHPKEVLMDPSWFKLYPVTQEQYDEWEKESKEYILKNYQVHKETLKRAFWQISLDCGPYVELETKD